MEVFIELSTWKHHIQPLHSTSSLCQKCIFRGKEEHQLNGRSYSLLQSLCFSVERTQLSVNVPGGACSCGFRWPVKGISQQKVLQLSATCWDSAMKPPSHRLWCHQIIKAALVLDKLPLERKSETFQPQWRWACQGGKSVSHIFLALCSQNKSMWQARGV